MNTAIILRLNATYQVGLRKARVMKHLDTCNEPVGPFLWVTPLEMVGVYYPLYQLCAVPSLLYYADVTPAVVGTDWEWRLTKAQMLPVMSPYGLVELVTGGMLTHCGAATPRKFAVSIRLNLQAIWMKWLELFDGVHPANFPYEMWHLFKKKLNMPQ